jgi:DNA polymerase elongation subunit (family B)
VEADTDGIYVASEAYYERPEALLKELVRHMPEGIELEFDGRYPAMFCYKAKNYALYDGGRSASPAALCARGASSPTHAG